MNEIDSIVEAATSIPVDAFAPLNAARQRNQAERERDEAVHTMKVMEGRMSAHECERRQLSNRDLKLKDELRNISKERDNALKRLTSLARERESSEREARNALTRAREQERRARRAEREIGMLRKSLDAKTNAMREKNARLQALDMKKREVSKSLAQALSKVREAEATIAKRNRDIGNKTAELLRLRNHVDKMKKAKKGGGNLWRSAMEPPGEDGGLTMHGNAGTHGNAGAEAPFRAIPPLQEEPRFPENEHVRWLDSQRNAQGQVMENMDTEPTLHRVLPQPPRPPPPPPLQKRRSEGVERARWLHLQKAASELKNRIDKNYDKSQPPPLTQNALPPAVSASPPAVSASPPVASALPPMRDGQSNGNEHARWLELQKKASEFKKHLEENQNVAPRKSATDPLSWKRIYDKWYEGMKHSEVVLEEMYGRSAFKDMKAYLVKTWDHDRKNDLAEMAGVARDNGLLQHMIKETARVRKEWMSVADGLQKVPEYGFFNPAAKRLAKVTSLSIA